MNEIKAKGPFVLPLKHLSRLQESPDAEFLRDEWDNIGLEIKRLQAERDRIRYRLIDLGKGIPKGILQLALANGYKRKPNGYKRRYKRKPKSRL